MLMSAVGQHPARPAPAPHPRHRKRPAVPPVRRRRDHDDAGVQRGPRVEAARVGRERRQRVHGRAHHLRKARGGLSKDVRRRGGAGKRGAGTEWAEGQNSADGERVGGPSRGMSHILVHGSQLLSMPLIIAGIEVLAIAHRPLPAGAVRDDRDRHGPLQPPGGIGEEGRLRGISVSRRGRQNSCSR